jgi:hypothetical protein
MQVPLSPYSPISVLLRQPLSIKKSYAGAIQRGKIVTPPILAQSKKFFAKY